MPHVVAIDSAGFPVQKHEFIAEENTGNPPRLGQAYDIIKIA